MLVGLVAHRGERCFDLLRFHADDIEVSRLQAISQILSQCAGLETDDVDGALEFIKVGNDLLNVRRQLRLGKALAIVVDNTNVHRPQ
jgi:hypothetical protein